MKPVLDKPLTINTVAGEATYRPEEPPHRPAYHITWQEARIVVADSGIFSGTMEKVAGEMYDQKSESKQVANTFTADHAEAVRKDQVLIMTGNITMVSKTQGATIRCDKVEWLAKQEIVKATGHVRISGTNGELTGLNEIWASPDFKVVATPEMYKKP